MGGLKNRSGVLIDGTREELSAAVKEASEIVGRTGFILGADCTLPTEIPYERVRMAVDAAREL
jgi:uroporphyrinogen decarboxylase